MQTKQRIFKFTNIQTLHAFLSLTVAKLSTLKYNPFLAHPVQIVAYALSGVVWWSRGESSYMYGVGVFHSEYGYGRGVLYGVLRCIFSG